MKNISDFQRESGLFTEYKTAPALCLDLDGTIRYSKKGKFINKPEDIALFDGVESKIWEYRDNGYLIFGITNQGGVAYGLKTLEGHQKELDAMMSLFSKNPFHTIKSSFHHPSGRVKPYNNRSLLRKPDIGMLVLCEVEAFEAGYVVNWEESLFIGDRPEDEQCAKNAGIKFQWAHEFFERNDPAGA
jgi:D-glycero-D-manno-heptose 1,7-bisphosphate phosphatase